MSQQKEKGGEENGNEEQAETVWECHFVWDIQCGDSQVDYRQIEMKEKMAMVMKERNKKEWSEVFVQHGFDQNVQKGEEN